MTTPDEDEAWRLIVDNYGETARRETDPPASSVPDDGSDDGSGEGAGDEPQEEAYEADERPPDVPQLDVPPQDPAGGAVPDERHGDPFPDPGPLPDPGPFLGPAYDETTPPPAPRDPDREERFVPPSPPPAPPMPWRRRAAWVGVFAAPLVFMLATMTNLHLPRWAVTVLLVGLVTGFGYLVLTMPKDPPDPWDDGSRV
ncbi:hypothetical protein [Nocardioides jishulii]|uniref:DUF308 domain-containing protein n=1 Tax=Nocardioides jishulii TaxID=2575440 RepID=A0A4U2YLG2_9ACTN|nr:hypothetical protein [Nocardioides jishulii]QCX27150.1 hypothetical protein FCL41_06100 [Nocardioides jishulii]TKI61634.1 hypothetical protein FC770_12735 [Nocardioides jishulii]